MKSFQLKLAATGLWLLTAVTGYAQQNIKIFGTITDSLTRQPISFAVVALLNQQTKAPVKGLQTDTSGHFSFENLPVGVFILRVSYVGYTDIVRENISVASSTGDLNLGTLQITASKNNLLKEVVVSAKKEALRNIDGKKVFAVNQSLVSNGGNAADLLQNIPTLQVDGDGNVSLRGSTGVKILIDGKPSIIGNGNAAQILQSIPANSIGSVEVIANPGAKYDANGQGIINIILKKNSRPGLNGSAAIGAGTRENYNADAALSYQYGKVKLYGNYSLKNGNTYSTGIQHLTFLKPTDSVHYSTETFPSVTRNKIQFAKAGIDYSVTPQSTLGLSASFNSRNTHRNEILDFTNFDSGNRLIQWYNRYNTIDNNSHSYELDVDYSQHFKKPKETLTFNFSYAHGSSADYQAYRSHFNSIKGAQTPADDALLNNIANNATSYNIQADYVLPVDKSGQFSAGYRSQVTLGDNDQYAYNISGAGETPLYAFTGFFGSNNQVHAVYVSYKNQVANFSYDVGLRAEDSHLNATLLSYDANGLLFADPVKVPVKGFYPNVQLTEKLKNNSLLQFTYTKRVLKPIGREVNSTIDFSDPANYYEGNPGLMPESIDNLELDYNKTWQNLSLTTGIYYNRTGNTIQHVQTTPVNDETTTIPENLSHTTTAGLELIGHFELLKGWDGTANANIFKRDNDAAPQFGIAANHGLSWNANITSNVTPVQRLSFQIRADYRAAEMIVQDKNRAVFGVDGAAKYDFAGSGASLSLNANNIFNTRKGAFLRSSNDLLLDWQRRTISSRATITFSWRFGSGSIVSKKESKQGKQLNEVL